MSWNGGWGDYEDAWWVRPSGAEAVEIEKKKMFKLLHPSPDERWITSHLCLTFCEENTRS